MARQTSFTSFNKRPRSIRLVLTELFSGRVSARLTELEERVFELEKRINVQATAIANQGTTVGMEKVRNSVASRVLRETRTHKNSSHGKFSTKSTEVNGLLNRPGFPGECFICELRLPDHRFRWKHNKLFLLLPEEYGPAFPAIVDCYTSPPT